MVIPSCVPLQIRTEYLLRRTFKCGVNISSQDSRLTLYTGGTGAPGGPVLKLDAQNVLCCDFWCHRTHFKYDFSVCFHRDW